MLYIYPAEVTSRSTRKNKGALSSSLLEDPDSDFLATYENETREDENSIPRQTRGSTRGKVRSYTVTTQHEPETVSQFEEPRITQAMKRKITTQKANV